MRPSKTEANSNGLRQIKINPAPFDNFSEGEIDKFYSLPLWDRLTVQEQEDFRTEYWSNVEAFLAFASKLPNCSDELEQKRLIRQKYKAFAVSGFLHDTFGHRLFNK